MNQPLVSCCMPTGNRRILGRQAINYWLRQTYKNTELVIVDGGACPLFELDDGDRMSGITYERVDPATTIGERRNRAAELAKGEIIMHWDDDDWYSAHRVERQVSALLDGALVCATAWLYRFHVVETAATEIKANYIETHGSTLTYWRSVWDAVKFEPVSLCEDGKWVHAVRAMGLGPIVDVHDDSLTVHVRHPRNSTFNRDQSMPMGQTAHINRVRELLGDDMRFYEELRELFPRPIVRPTFEGWRNDVPDSFARRMP